MEVVEYQPEKHNDMLLTWYNQWGLSPHSIELLPGTGLIIENVCALFLYRTNSLLCLVEGFISNREAEDTVRAQGLDLISSKMDEWIKELGFKQIMTFSNNPKVIERAKSMNFDVSKEQYNVLYRRI